jgi:hypothetical protein
MADGGLSPVDKDCNHQKLCYSSICHHLCHKFCMWLIGAVPLYCEELGIATNSSSKQHISIQRRISYQEAIIS